MRQVIKTVLLTLLAVSFFPVWANAEQVTPRIEANVGQLDQKKASFSIGQSHLWILRCVLPETEAARDYTIHQTLPPSLSFEPESVRAEFLPEEGAGIFLSMGEDFTVTAGSVFVENGTSDRFSLSLTEAGSRKLRSGGELRIFYEAALRETAPIGTQILSSAQLMRGGETYHSQWVSVYTGGFRILLTDLENRPQPGGRFMVARPAGEADLADASVTKEHLDIGGTPVAVVYESFYDHLGRRTSVLETGERGEAGAMGLAFGTYYLVRIDIPAVPVKVMVEEGSHLTASDGWKDSRGRQIDNTVRIRSGSVFLPQTGGPGTGGYTAVGTMVILCACILLWYNRKGALYKQ